MGYVNKLQGTGEKAAKLEDTLMTTPKMITILSQPEIKKGVRPVSRTPSGPCERGWGERSRRWRHAAAYTPRASTYAGCGDAWRANDPQPSPGGRTPCHVHHAEEHAATGTSAPDHGCSRCGLGRQCRVRRGVCVFFSTALEGIRQRSGHGCAHIPASHHSPVPRGGVGPWRLTAHRPGGLQQHWKRR
jgi:hypothetical protein